MDSCFQIQSNLKGADWSRHAFIHSAIATALPEQSPTVSPFSPFHCGQYDTMHATLGCVVRKAFTDDTDWGNEREPARTLHGYTYLVATTGVAAGQSVNIIVCYNTINQSERARRYDFGWMMTHGTVRIRSHLFRRYDRVPTFWYLNWYE